MIIITEHKLTEEQEANFEDLNYTIRYAYDIQKGDIKPGEGVGFYLSRLSRTTINLIEWCLYTKHKIAIKYQDKTYKLDKYEEWKHTYQDPKDQLKKITVKHPLYQEYLDKRKEYQDQVTAYHKQKYYEDTVSQFIYDIPEDIDTFLGTFAPLYDIQIDMQDEVSKLIAYQQIRYYLDNNIPYSNEIKCIYPDEEPMFEGMFQSIQEEPIEIEYFGNEIYFEDYINKSLTC